MKLNKIDKEQKLFVLECGGGFSCLGFEVLETRCVALSRELAALGYSLPAPAFFGTVERFGQYANRLEIASEHHAKTGYRFHCELTKCLVGHEGERVEVVTPDGERRRFWVGKSTGFIPCHLEISRRNSSGGGPVCIPEGSTVRLVASGRVLLAPEPKASPGAVSVQSGAYPALLVYSSGGEVMAVEIVHDGAEVAAKNYNANLHTAGNVSVQVVPLALVLKAEYLALCLRGLLGCCELNLDEMEEGTRQEIELAEDALSGLVLPPEPVED